MSRKSEEHYTCKVRGQDKAELETCLPSFDTAKIQAIKASVNGEQQGTDFLLSALLSAALFICVIDD